MELVKLRVCETVYLFALFLPYLSYALKVENSLLDVIKHKLFISLTSIGFTLKRFLSCQNLHKIN